MVAHFRGDASPRRVGELRRLDDLAALFAAIGNDCLAQRMFRTQLGGSRCCDEFIGIDTRRGQNLLHLRAAKRQGAGLIEHDRIDPAQCFQVDAALDDGTETRRTANTAENGKGRSGRDAAGACNNDHRDRRPDVRGNEIGERCRSEREIDEIAGQAVGEPLNRRARPFGALNRLDDLAVARIAADAFGLNLQRPGLVDRTGVNMTAGELLGRHGFTGDTGFVGKGMAREHLAVYRNASAWGDQDGVTDGKFLGRNRTDRTRAPHRDLSRQEFEQIADRPASASHRHSLEDLRHQHEKCNDQRRKELTDCGGSHDRNRHRQLHRHAALEDVLERFLQDRPATDQEAGDANKADR